MINGNKKGKPLHPYPENGPGTKSNRGTDNNPGKDEIQETDDKLIGDDLAFKDARQVAGRDKDSLPETGEQHY